MQQPTIGRIVHYYLPVSPGFASSKIQPCAAIITGVSELEHDVVSLCVFIDQATPKGRAKTQQVRSRYSETPVAYCWSWPPRAGS